MPRRCAALALGALTLSSLAHPAAGVPDPTEVDRARATTVSLQVLPPIHHHGATPRRSRTASTVVVATVAPPRAGRLITLQQRAGQTWRPESTLATDAAGRVKFLVPTRRRDPGSYRAIVSSSKRLLPGTSDVISDQWGAADFTDEFTGGTLSPAWDHRIQFYNPWGGRSCSKGSPAAVSVFDGALHLSSMPDPAAASACPAVDRSGAALGDFPFRLNGHVSTQDSFDFRYGVAAARMKFQRSPGAHPSFWLQPRGLLTTGPTPWGAEIDVVEWYGRVGNRDRLASTVHAPLPGGDKRQIGGAVPRPGRFLTSRSDTWWRNYHVFSVEWTPTEYIFRINDREVWRTDQGISHEPEFLILSMLSSDFELPRLGDRQGTTQTASVDWVKVWQADAGSGS